jgi:hypothetical protein
VPVALCELMRGQQIVCDRAEAEQVLTYLRDHATATTGRATHAPRPTCCPRPASAGPPPIRAAARAAKNPAKSAVARKILIAAWHVLSRQEPFKLAASRRPDPASASSRCFLAA